MAGLFVSFFIEYAAHQIADRFMPRKDATEGNAILSRQMINISVMEAGILFHSLLIGLTLVVTGDAFFITLSIVIIFHQAFEGIALGSCIAALGRPGGARLAVHNHSHHFPHDTPVMEGGLDDDQAELLASAVPLRKKLFLASGFALVTPAGMAIGICLLNRFNGNDPATIWAIGSLDAFSAGILVWVGIVEMWAGDWMLGGCMAHSSPLVSVLGLASLLSGMGLMSFLGKWA
ncbi:hypothetical protein jhhlp_000682 [Lomentospora prolificans]|uniref:Zinc/iron permease n=1 Tax=Lomentospora prolificans TaxID=41688 RepID=A0A2N3NJ50_9PEZI|nr:hypothetical protein jhhlp_000682 [Lomentospora prolificans]